jgi:flagellar basal body-associated protein FliL
MAEESENSGGGSFKSIIIGLASTVALGVGGYVTKTLTGEGDEPAPQAVTAPAPVINITTNNTQQQKNVVGGGGSGIAKPAAAPKPKPKTAKEELEEAPKW